MFSLKIRKYGSPHHTFLHGSNSMQDTQQDHGVKPKFLSQASLHLLCNLYLCNDTRVDVANYFSLKMLCSLFHRTVEVFTASPSSKKALTCINSQEQKTVPFL